ncbi:MAG: TIGR00730 family Rossman fold protein [Actinomycetia bacterium]|nr:TIGR00730 family Rossman fold protein [Actinomycetes bacterium]
MTDLNRVCVFCGSSPGDSGDYAVLAVELGHLLAQRGIELVYGGGDVGLMGTVADAAMSAGGQVTGVIPTGLFSKEVAHRGVTNLVEVDSMHDRKAQMYELADGFIALPGGLGTLEELAEASTWTQLGIHNKPVVLLDRDGFWNGLVDWLDGAVAARFLKDRNRRIIVSAGSPEEALEVMAAWAEPYAEKWLDTDEA